MKKILIANRGEIAVRILRTCREMGIDTVSVHSTEDEDSLHVKLADESVCIGPPRSTYSYLNIPSILSAAEITGSDAIHPGFGFLSENQEFALFCQKWNITFIGPNPKVMDDMGDKINAKLLAEKAGVPVLKTIVVDFDNLEDTIEQVCELGFPVIIKAAAGGGGKGMKLVNSPQEIRDSIDRLAQEVLSAFADKTLFIEKYIQNPRHIEVQIVADQHGNVIHLGERDCTVQRNYQKLIEESPSPVLTPTKREEICQSAVRLARYVGYDSVGTVEFLYDMKSEQYFFMEMNTRIQVEHPVTELRTGIDLVALQIRIARKEKLPFTQEQVTFRDHVIECRVNAEHPATYAPSPGLISYYYRPGGIGIRVDDFIYSGYRVSPYYDSMLAKVISYASNREACIARMLRALDEMVIDGIHTNIVLHKEILSHKSFKKGHYSTSFLSEIR